MAEVKKHYEAELERANNEAKRLRAEINNKSSDLETTRNNARLLEQKQSLMDAELEARCVYTILCSEALLDLESGMRDVKEIYKFADEVKMVVNLTLRI